MSVPHCNWDMMAAMKDKGVAACAAVGPGTGSVRYTCGSLQRGLDPGSSLLRRSSDPQVWGRRLQGRLFHPSVQLWSLAPRCVCSLPPPTVSCFREGLPSSGVGDLESWHLPGALQHARLLVSEGRPLWWGALHSMSLGAGVQAPHLFRGAWDAECSEEDPLVVY